MSSRIVNNIFILFLGIIGIISIQCSEDSKQAKNKKDYEVKSSFLYSNDDGKTYDSRTDFKVGETVYMKAYIQVYKKNRFAPSLDFVNCELIIPNITSVDAKYYEGTFTTPLIDKEAGITTYPLKIGIADKKSEDINDIENSFTFQFIPKKESEISIILIFDDNISRRYDKINTIKFVK